ncbi:MAG: SdpI family protein [Spirochaetes bacterium]|nr:SdpI family protein [Spirochaetota bacterium]
MSEDKIIFIELESTAMIMVILGFLMQFVKQNEFFGARTSATLSSPKVWEQVNKVSGILFAIFGSILFIWNLVAYVQGRFMQLIAITIIAIIASLIVLTIFVIIYGDRLAQEEKMRGTLKPFTISKALVFTFAIISFATAIFGMFLIVNLAKFELQLIGACFIAVGIFFGIAFLRTTNKEGTVRSKMFEKYYPIFIGLTLILSVISALLYG